MEQLSALDASFLNRQTPVVHCHTGALALFEVDPDVRPLEAVKTFVEDSLGDLDPFRRRLAEVPFGLDRPYWVEDPAFDLDFHVRSIALPAPGGPEQLADLLSRLHSLPLDRSRPLWELYVIEGIEGGLVGHYTKVHNSAVDGRTGAEVMSTLLDESPDRRPHPTPTPWTPDRQPSAGEMLARGLLGLATQPAAQARMQRRMARNLLDAGRRQLGPWLSTMAETSSRTPWMPASLPWSPRRHADESQPSAVAPRVSFNTSISPHRRYAYTSVSLDTVKAIKNRFDTTVNDVILAVCAGALRSLLQRQEELPTDPLIALAPMSVTTGAKRAKEGVTAVLVVIPTNEDDPEQRLRKAAASVRAASDEGAAVPADLLQDFAQFAPPAVAARAARMVAQTRIGDYANPQFNVVISNIPGPQEPLYSAGSRLTAVHPIADVIDGIGLDISLFSYDGAIHFGLTASREAIPDLWPLADAIGDAVDELSQLTGPTR